MQPSSGSYDQVQKALAGTQRGSYGDLSYMPVFRASALFYALCGKDITTRISFLNYWREKNGNADVSVMLTVRDEQGLKRKRFYTPLVDMTYDFDLRSFVDEGEEFRGSMELEAFSAEDLKFQFPGVSVFYQTARGVSYVHTGQRVYNGAEDRARGAELNPWQTGFEINAEQFEPFIFIVNGPIAYAGGEVDFIVLNARRHELHRRVKMQALPPYGTLDLRLKSIEGVEQFLGGEAGLCKVDLKLTDVHLRLGVGNGLKDCSWFSITHSYFDATDHDDYFDTSDLDAHVRPAFIPFVLVDSLDVDLLLYPIYARSSMRLRLQGFDAEGSERCDLLLDDYRTPEDGMRRLAIRELLAERSVPATAGLYVLQFDAEGHKLPARITYGLNYHTADKLGTNISASAYLSKTWGAGKRAWKWGPVVALNGGRNLIMICSVSTKKGVHAICAGTLALYDRNGCVLTKAFKLQSNSCVTLVGEELMVESGYFPKAGDILWYVVQSAEAALDVNHVCISADGFVGGDHSF